MCKSDVKRFYDSICVVRVGRYLVQQGCDKALVKAMVICQMLPVVFLGLLSCKISLGRRGLGCLTGTRTAGTIGQIIIQETFQSRKRVWKPWGFPFAGKVLCVCAAG